ncbi:MAG: hypothetical protein KDK66_05410 [Deltaproteobacteria bacterium]|nr:hypothetical protein [Deltaproteobacteria bacterium]
MTKKPLVKPLDLSKIPKLSREYLELERALRLRYPWLFADGPLEHLQKSFYQILGKPLSVKSQGVKERSLHSFLQESAGQSLMAQVRRGENEFFWIRIDRSLVPPLLSSILGETVPVVREKPSDLEKGLLEFWLLKSLHWAKESLKDKLNWELQHWGLYEEGFARDQKDASGCVFSFLLGMEGQAAYAWIYLPHPILEGLLLTDSSWDEEPQDLSSLEATLPRVAHLKTSVWPEIGRVSLSPEEQQALEVGDVILFDHSDAQLTAHGLTGKALLRVGENLSEGLLTEVLDSGTTFSLKILAYDGE